MVVLFVLWGRPRGGTGVLETFGVPIPPRRAALPERERVLLDAQGSDQGRTVVYSFLICEYTPCFDHYHYYLRIYYDFTYLLESLDI